jgi:hypothetical protein
VNDRRQEDQKYQEKKADEKQQNNQETEEPGQAVSFKKRGQRVGDVGDQEGCHDREKDVRPSKEHPAGQTYGTDNQKHAPSIAASISSHYGIGSPWMLKLEGGNRGWIELSSLRAGRRGHA